MIGEAFDMMDSGVDADADELYNGVLGEIGL